MEYYKPKISDKVQFKTSLFEGTGIIVYIDSVNLYNDWAYPIQIITDEPYDENGHKILRLNLKDIIGVL